MHMRVSTGLTVSELIPSGTRAHSKASRCTPRITTPCPERCLPIQKQRALPPPALRVVH